MARCFPFDNIRNPPLQLGVLVHFLSETPPVLTDIVFPPPSNLGEVDKIRSTMTAERMRHLGRNYLFPSSSQLILPGPDHRASCPPVGFFTIYESALECGLRFPLHQGISDLMHRLNVPLGQLMPNTFLHLCGLGIAAFDEGAMLTPDLFLSLFVLKTNKSWFFSSARSKLNFVTKNKHNFWKQKYFYCRIEGVPEKSWGKKLKSTSSSADLGQIVKDLDELGVVGKELDEEELAAAGLSPYDPAYMVKPAKGEALFCFLYVVIYILIVCFFSQHLTSFYVGVLQ